MQNQKTLTIAAILGAAVLIAGIVAAVTTTTPLTAYADRDYKKDKDDRKEKKDNKGDTSITATKQTLKQKNIGSGDSDNSNCGQNPISSLGIGVCPDASVTLDLGNNMDYID